MTDTKTLTARELVAAFETAVARRERLRQDVTPAGTDAFLFAATEATEVRHAIVRRLDRGTPPF